MLPLGSFEIIVKFSGSGNLAAEQAILPVTLNAAELKLESAHGISRFYRKGDRSIEFDSFTISGYVPGFEDARLSLSGGTLSGQVKSAAPGRYTEAFFSEFPALTGRYADYYKLYAPLTAGTDVEIWSAPTVQPGPNSGQPGKQGYEKWGKTGAPVSFTVDADGNALSYQWYIVRDGIATALRDSDLYTGTNTPTLTIVRADPLMDGQRFLCVVTNPAGEAQIEFVLKLYAQAAIPQTGDSALPMLWIALMFMSLTGTTLLVRRREQR